MIRIKDCVTTLKGFAFKSSWYSKSGYPLIKVSNFGQDNIKDSEFELLPEEIQSKYTKYAVEKNDVLIQTVGSWPSNPNSVVGKVVKCQKGTEGFLLNQNIVKLIPNNGINKLYLFYTLKNNDFKNYIVSRATGSASQASITLVDILDYSFKLPTLIIQQKIASILSTYDELIENNNKRIKILEQIAESIYRKWFINFKFPGYEKVKMVDSELGKIPEGWEIKKLEDYAFFIKGVEPGSANYLEKSSKETVPFLRVGDLNKRSNSIFIETKLSKNVLVNEDDILISLDGTVGILGTGFYGAYSTGIRKVNPKNEYINKSFIYQLLKSESIQNIIKSHANGTTILHAGNSIHFLYFTLPKIEVMKSFENIINPIMKLVNKLKNKNILLEKIKSMLLSKLISGELDVENLDIKIRPEIL